MEFEELSSESEALLREITSSEPSYEETSIEFSPQADELSARGFIRIVSSYYDGTHCVMLTPDGAGYFKAKAEAEKRGRFGKANKIAVLLGNFLGSFASKFGE